VAEKLPPVLLRMLDLWNGGAIDPADVYGSGCVENGDSTFEPQEILPSIHTLRSGLPDLHFTVEDSLRAGDRYVLRLRAEGKHAGVLQTPLGLAKPTGRSISMRGIEVFEVSNDRIVSVWVGWNFGDLYAGLGAKLPK
jgi:predicted ester cyclase